MVFHTEKQLLEVTIAELTQCLKEQAFPCEGLLAVFIYQTQNGRENTSVF